jgi:hypothetical protein
MEDPEEHDEARRPLVLERFRSLGWLALVLVPLLVITLAQVAVSLRWAIVVLIGGLVLLVALRERADED